MAKISRERQHEMGLVQRVENKSTFVEPEWQPAESAQLPAVNHQQPIVIPQVNAPAVDVTSKSFASIQGTFTDHERALRFKFFMVLGLIAATNAGTLLAARLIIRAGGIPHYATGWVVLTAALGLWAYLRMDNNEHKHSPAGVEHAKVKAQERIAIETHKTTMETIKHIYTNQTDRFFDYLEASDERRYNAKQLPKRDQ